MRLNHPIVLLGTALAVLQMPGVGYSSGKVSKFNPSSYHSNNQAPTITQYTTSPDSLRKNAQRIVDVEQVEAFIRKTHSESSTKTKGQLSGANLLKQLRFAKKTHSLTADHYVFDQVKNGIPVDGGKLIVSVDAKTGQVLRTYSRILTGKAVATGKTIQKDAAYDNAWQDLWVSGKLLSAPKIKLTYHQMGKNLVPVYKTFLHTSSPSGAWETVIDARSGKVLSQKDTRIFTKPRQVSRAKVGKFGKLTDREQAFAQYAIRALPKARKAAKFYNNAEFSGYVFDPDPRTTSGNNGLLNTSEASAFEGQYRKVPLKDLSTNADGNYILQGPWVKIIDFESPNDPPLSSRPDGIWNAKRSDAAAFAEVMVYYHLDTNQRYIQELFNNDPARRIQFKAIEADSNGVNGEDNSHYIPSSNRLAFGHGCVPDPEDVDVILHEYGHAIQHDINPDWDGADTGAIGEGFGDYWAGSYSLAKILEQNPNAPMDHFVTNVFNWDGHGGGECWPGRKLTNKEVRYDPSRFYGAHQTIPNGNSDELWSGPIFLALLDVVAEQETLEAKLEARRMMDTIILESHFGLGGEITMRMMANATIDAAMRLAGRDSSYVKALTKWFQHYNISEDPRVRLTLADITLNKDTIGDNGAVDPGEEIAFRLEIANMGRNGSKTVDGTVQSGTSTATMYETYATYGDIEGRATAKGSNDYTLAVSPDHTCGEPLLFNMSMDYQEKDVWKNIQVPFSIGTGVAQMGSGDAAPAAAIPDAEPAGVTSTINVGSEVLVDENFKVSVNITHPYIGDLKITLISPKGTKVILHNETGAASDDIITTYPSQTQPHENFSRLYGEPLAGEWQLHIKDAAKEDKGVLNSWKLDYVNSFICSSRK